MRSEVLREGSIDIHAVQSPRGQVFSRCKSELSIVLRKGRFPSRILFFGTHPCLKLAESQSEDDDAEFIKMHMSDRRRWQDGGSAVS